MEIARRTQLTVYLENQVGALAGICRLIEEREINLLAISVFDTVEEGVLRIVPEDPEAAAQALEDHGFRVIESQILLIEIDNDFGATGRIASKLAGGAINIDYLYSSAHPEQDRAILILRTHQIEEAEALLLGRVQGRNVQ